MKTYLVVSALSVAALFAAPACAQQLVPAGSEIAFTSKQMGVPVDGKFRKFSAQVASTPRSPRPRRSPSASTLASARFGAAETEGEVVKPTGSTRRSFRRPASRALHQACRRGQVRGGGQAHDQGRKPERRRAGGADAGRRHHHRHRWLHAQAPRFQDRRRRLEADTSMVADDVQVRFKLALTGVGAL
jgi:hypothetical protein